MIRCPAHLKWIRTRFCEAILSGGCGGRVEAAHVRTGTDGGMGMKPSDCWVIPLCTEHHREQHRIGEAAFEKKHRLNLKGSAEEMAGKSPYLRRME